MITYVIICSITYYYIVRENSVDTSNVSGRITRMSGSTSWDSENSNKNNKINKVNSKNLTCYYMIIQLFSQSRMISLSDSLLGAPHLVGAAIYQMVSYSISKDNCKISAHGSFGQIFSANEICLFLHHVMTKESLEILISWSLQLQLKIFSNFFSRKTALPFFKKIQQTMIHVT